MEEKGVSEMFGKELMFVISVLAEPIRAIIKAVTTGDEKAAKLAQIELMLAVEKEILKRQRGEK